MASTACKYLIPSKGISHPSLGVMTGFELMTVMAIMTVDWGIIDERGSKSLGGPGWVKAVLVPASAYPPSIAPHKVTVFLRLFLSQPILSKITDSFAG